MSRDLVLLVADKNMEGALRGLLSRPQSLGLREISCDLFIHPERDPGCLLRSHLLLQPFVHSHSRALVLFDMDGCGQESLGRAALERQVEARLFGAGWGDRAAAVVIDPELEVWVWNDSPHVAKALGWEDGESSLKEWLKEKAGFLKTGPSRRIRKPRWKEPCASRAGRGRQRSTSNSPRRSASTAAWTRPS